MSELQSVRSFLSSHFSPFRFTPHCYPNAIGLLPNEQESLFWLAANSRADCNWMEIGSFCGGSAVLMCLARRALARKTEGCQGFVYSVDRHFESAFDRNISFGGFGDISRKLGCDSLGLAAHYDGSPISFCFIDGWHSFKGALTDLLTVSPWLTPGAYVAFHDVAQQPYGPGAMDAEYANAKANYDTWMAEELPNPRTGEQTYNLDAVVAYAVKELGFEPVNVPVLDGSKNHLTAIRKLANG